MNNLLKSLDSLKLKWRIHYYKHSYFCNFLRKEHLSTLKSRQMLIINNHSQSSCVLTNFQVLRSSLNFCNLFAEKKIPQDFKFDTLHLQAFQADNSPRQNEHGLRNFDLSEYRQVFSDLAVWIYQTMIKQMQESVQQMIGKLQVTWVLLLQSGPRLDKFSRLTSV